MSLNYPDALPAAIDLAAEADHRIANHLTLVNGICRIQASALRRRSEPLSAAEASAIVDGIGAKVEAVSLLHRRLARRERRLQAERVDLQGSRDRAAQGAALGQNLRLPRAAAEP